MAGEVRWSYAHVRLWMIMGGVEFPLVGCHVEYELNAVPRAMAILPVGRSVDTGAPAAIHAVADQLRAATPAEIWMEFSARDASDAAAYAALGLPSGPFRLFAGYTSGTSLALGDGARYAVSINHWLVRLGETSAMSRSSHPATPAFFALGALANVPGTGAHMVTTTKASEFFAGAGLDDDLWGKAIGPWLRELCQVDGFWAAAPGLPKGNGGKNVAALQALARMAAPIPLAFRRGMTEFDQLTSLIGKDVEATLARPEMVASMTLWDILVGKLAPDYAFAVVPRPEDALIVPFVPGYRGDNGGTPYAVISADQYRPLLGHTATPRLLRAYGLLVDAMHATDTNIDGEAGAALNIGGVYDAGGDGAILFGRPPGWLQHLDAPEIYVAVAAGGDRKAVRSAASPAAGQAHGARGKKRAGQARMVRRLLDDMSQQRYAENILQGRFLSLTGPVRLDLAPGSLVTVEVAPERALVGQDALAATQYASVLKHTISIDASAGSAQSMLQLGHVRSVAENASDSTSIDHHPLYAKAFLGAPLVG